MIVSGSSTISSSASDLYIFGEIPDCWSSCESYSSSTCITDSLSSWCSKSSLRSNALSTSSSARFFFSLLLGADGGILLDVLAVLYAV